MRNPNTFPVPHSAAPVRPHLPRAARSLRACCLLQSALAGGSPPAAAPYARPARPDSRGSPPSGRGRRGRRGARPASTMLFCSFCWSLLFCFSDLKYFVDFFYSSCVLSRRSRTMAIFSSAHLALRRSLMVAPRAASLGESLRQASDGHFTGRLLHGQLLLRCFTSDVFGPNKVFLPHPNSLHQFHPRFVRLIKPQAWLKYLVLR